MYRSLQCDTSRQGQWWKVDWESRTKNGLPTLIRPAREGFPEEVVFQLTLGIRRRFWNLPGKEMTPGPFSPYLLYFSSPVPAARRIFLNSMFEYLHPLISNLHSFPTSVQEIQTKPHSLVYFSAWSQCSHLPPPCPQPHPFFSSEFSAGLLHTLWLSQGIPSALASSASRLLLQGPDQVSPGWHWPSSLPSPHSTPRESWSFFFSFHSL